MNPVAPMPVALGLQANAVLREMTPWETPSCIVRAVLDDPESTVRELSSVEFQRLETIADITETIGKSGAGAERWIDELNAKVPALQERLEALRAAPPEQFRVAGPTAPRWPESIGAMPQDSQLNWSVALGDQRFDEEFRRQVEKHGAAAIQTWLPGWLALKRGDDLLHAAWALHELLGQLDAVVRKVPRYVSRGSYRDASPAYRSVAAHVFVRLNEDLGADFGGPANGPLREVTLRYGLMALSGAKQSVAEEIRQRMVAIAKLDLASMRATCAEAHTIEGRAQFNSRLLHFHACSEALCTFGSLATALPQLLLLLQSLSVPAVTEDLNYWDVCPLPFTAERTGNFFQYIPGALIGAVHQCGADEMTRDPSLEDARLKVADFCLRRLGQKKDAIRSPLTTYADQDSLIEDDRHWRICFIRAAECLRINPRGRGHHVLDWTAKHDPDPAVRVAAKEAYPELRRPSPLKIGTSPRRPLITALWWLFQAHRLSLGAPIREEKIQATLAAFLRRTTERDPSLAPRVAPPGWAFAGPPKFTPLSP